MSNLATDVLRNLKKYSRVWQIATVITTVIAIAEFMIIVF